MSVSQKTRNAPVQFQCSRKKRYDTLEGARTSASHARDRSGHDISAYPCIYCGGFHIGHTPGYKAYRARKKKRYRARKREKAKFIDIKSCQE